MSDGHDTGPPPCRVRLPSGEVVTARGGASLLEPLYRRGWRVHAPCGGRGTCGNCQVFITERCGPTQQMEIGERCLLGESAAGEGVRLACRVRLPAGAELDVVPVAGCWDEPGAVFSEPWTPV